MSSLPEDLGEKLEAKLQQLLPDLVREVGGPGMVGHFVLIAVVYDDDGDRSLLTATHEDARAWETLGLLEACRGVEQARLTVDEIEGEED